MSIRTVVLALGAIVIAVPGPARSQEGEADFVKARREFVAGQTRQAAQTLIMSSLAVRQQLGRCRDDDVGTGLMDAESKLEKLAASIRGGSVTSVKTLDQQLIHVDRLLARHHLQLAMTVVAHPRAGDLPVAARDIGQSAFHFERSITLNGTPLASEQAAAVKDARALADEIEKTNALPERAKTVLAALEKQVIGGTAVSVNPAR